MCQECSFLPKNLTDAISMIFVLLHNYRSQFIVSTDTGGSKTLVSLFRYCWCLHQVLCFCVLCFVTMCRQARRWILGEFLFSAIHFYVTNRTACYSEVRPTSLRLEVAYCIIVQIAYSNIVLEIIKTMAQIFT